MLVRELPTKGFVVFSPDWTFTSETGPEGLRIAGADDSESCFFPKWFDGHGSSCIFASDNSLSKRPMIDYERMMIAGWFTIEDRPIRSTA